MKNYYLLFLVVYLQLLSLLNAKSERELESVTNLE